MTILIILFTALILLFPKYSLSFAATGLTLWFDCMVPVLFPFMVLSGIMIRQNMTASFAGIFHPVLGKLYNISKDGVYCLITGFLCGFPMGAKVIGELYACHRLNRREAEHLLAFCNNIGPVYFTGFLIPTIGMSGKYFLPCLFGMYGIPLLYGMFLRCSGLFLPPDINPTQDDKESALPKESFFASMENAMQSSINSITTLGGYMILFNLLNIIPHIFYVHTPLLSNPLPVKISGLLFEITGGVKRMGTTLPLLTLTLLPLGGMSCLMQTRSMLRETDLSMGRHLAHKLIQTILTAAYYLFLFRLF